MIETLKRQLAAKNRTRRMEKLIAPYLYDGPTFLLHYQWTMRDYRTRIR
jgi:hypothetical protein